jgi:hypothetical protein
MAQHITVAIPDSLAERMERFRSRISPSELLQAAISRRLDDLEALAKAETATEKLKASVASFLRDRDPSHARVAKAAVDDYLSDERGTHAVLAWYPELSLLASSGLDGVDQGLVNDLCRQFAVEESDLAMYGQQEYFVEEFARLVVEQISRVIDAETHAALL